MRRMLLRAFVTLAAFVVVWLSSGRAMASTVYTAPLCDPRGAVVLAPPPQVQPLEMSLDIVTNDDDCTESPLDVRHATPGRAPTGQAPSASQPPAVHFDVLASLRPSMVERLPAPDARRDRPCPGFRDSLDRPPRA